MNEGDGEAARGVIRHLALSTAILYQFPSLDSCTYWGSRERES